MKRSVMRATRELVAEGGPGAVTMEAVAARAGVGKPTLYRWWPDRHAIAMAALMDEGDAPRPSGARPSPIAALRQQLQTIATRFTTTTGRHITTMIAASDSDSELSKAFRNHFVLARRAEGRALLLEAMRQGELRRDLDVEVALDLLYGPLFFRLLMGHGPLDQPFMGRVLDCALLGMQARAGERRGQSKR